VNDVIIDPGGDVVGVVIGVGGFLGVGEKPVAVALNRLTISQTATLDDAKVVFNVSLAELEAAPAFKSAHAMKMEEEAEQQAIKYPPSMTALPQTVPPVPATQ
jgi:PRC-barrel domain